MQPPRPEADRDQLVLWDDEAGEERWVAESAPAVTRVRSVRRSSAAIPPVDAGGGERLWDINDVSAFLGVPVATLYQWRVKGGGPPATRMGKHLRFEPAVVRSWVSEHREGA